MVGMNPGPVRDGADGRAVRRRRRWCATSSASRGRSGSRRVEHPRRPIAGFDCHRSEVSGTRFWGWARDRFGTAERFFERVYVANWCPLVFMEESGRNVRRTSCPPPSARRSSSVCNEALARVAETLARRSSSASAASPSSGRARRSATSVRIGRILHPSPASPAANNDWPASSTRSFARSASSPS